MLNEAAQVCFVNPANGATYAWPNNPGWDAETQNGNGYQQKAIQIEYTSNTGNIGLTRQQGDDGPFIIDWTFNCYTSAFEQQLWNWYALSKSQSIYLRDFADQWYEGQIITLARMRTGAMGGPGDIAAIGYYSTFHMQFDVWVQTSGPLAAAGLTT